MPVWLAFVFVIGFPNELWFEERIKDCFRGFAEVAEIDPVCLSGENFGPLRLLLEVNDRLDIPRELRISYRRGVGRLGAVATVHPIRVWPREFQLDSRGNLATFFGPPAPPGAGPSLGPMGPMTSEQQLRPRPHVYSLAFPTNGTPRFASNLQRAFDPLRSLVASADVQVMARALILARLLPGAPAADAQGEVMPTPEPARVSPARAPASPPGRAPKPLITYQRRRLRSKLQVAACNRNSKAGADLHAKAGRRSSLRLAAKAPTTFIDMTTIAVQRKALLNSLSTCSTSLKNHVNKRNMLSRNRLPMNASELRKLVSAAKIDSPSAAAGTGSLVTANTE